MFLYSEALYRNWRKLFFNTACFMIQFHLKWHIPQVSVLCPKARIPMETFALLAGPPCHIKLTVDYSDYIKYHVP